MNTPGFGGIQTAFRAVAINRFAAHSALLPDHRCRILESSFKKANDNARRIPMPPEVRQPRPRPYRSLGSDELVAKLFEVAFNQDAAEFEHVRFEIVGGADGWAGRNHVKHVPHLLQAAQRILELETTPGPARPGASELLSLVAEVIEDGGLSCEDVVYQLHCAAYSEQVADALKEINQRVLELVE